MSVGPPDARDAGFIALEHAPADAAAAGDGPKLGLSMVALRIPRDGRAAALKVLAERGIAVLHQTRWTLYFNDPEGNRIALSHHPADPV
jgi:glyoxylase I family protein